MKGTRIGLNEFQNKILKPLYDEMNKSNKPMALFAQIIRTSGGGVLDVRLIGPSMAEKIQKAVGQKPGKLFVKGEKISVLAPDEDLEGR